MSRWRLAILLGGMLLLLAHGAEPEGEARQVLGAENAAIHAPTSTELWNVTTLFQLCSREVDGLLKTPLPPPVRLEVFVLHRPVQPGDERLDRIVVDGTGSIDELTLRLFRGLVARRAAFLLKRRRMRPTPAMEFLAVALTQRMLYAGKGARGIYLPDFRVPRRQFAAGVYPRVERLVEHPVATTSPVLFRLYLVHCDLLLNCLENATRNLPGLLTTWWGLELVDGNRCMDALQEALGEGAFREGETMQQWYERQARERASSGRFRNDAETIAEELKELSAIPVLDADSSMGVRLIPMEQLPELLESYKLDNRALTTLMNRLLYLKRTSPPLLATALDDYMAALGAIQAGKAGEFRRRLAAAKTGFAAAQQRQRQVEELLDRVEKRDGGVDYERNALWEAVLRHSAELWGIVGRAAGFPEE